MERKQCFGICEGKTKGKKYPISRKKVFDNGVVLPSNIRKFEHSRESFDGMCEKCVQKNCLSREAKPILIALIRTPRKEKGQRLPQQIT